MWLWNLKFSMFFVLIQYPWNRDFVGPYSPKYCLILMKLWSEVISNKKNIVFGKSFKILNFGSNGMRLRFTVLVHFGAQFTDRKPKLLLKPKISAKNASLGIIPRSQKNYWILKKLSQKTFFGPKFGLKCHHESKVHHTNSHIAYHRASIYTVWMSSFSFWVFTIADFSQKEPLHILGSGPFEPTFGIFWGIIPVNNVWLR